MMRIASLPRKAAVNEMPNSQPNSRQNAKVLWDSGNYLEAGVLLFESLPNEEKPHLAAAVLDLTVQWFDAPVCGVRLLQRIARQKWRWRGAYSAFQKIRNRTIRLESREMRTHLQDLMLCQCGVAENVAKVIYNATDPIDPFDEDAGAWIVPCLKNFIDCLGKPEFEVIAVSLLFDESRPVVPENSIRQARQAEYNLRQQQP